MEIPTAIRKALKRIQVSCKRVNEYDEHYFRLDSRECCGTHEHITGKVIAEVGISNLVHRGYFWFLQFSTVDWLDP